MLPYTYIFFLFFNFKWLEHVIIMTGEVNNHKKIIKQIWKIPIFSCNFFSVFQGSIQISCTKIFYYKKNLHSFWFYRNRKKGGKHRFIVNNFEKKKKEKSKNFNFSNVNFYQLKKMQFCSLILLFLNLKDYIL